ncbi:unnamed protein product [Boreogadus saida]
MIEISWCLDWLQCNGTLHLHVQPLPHHHLPYAIYYIINYLTPDPVGSLPYFVNSLFHQELPSPTPIFCWQRLGAAQSNQSARVGGAYAVSFGHMTATCVCAELCDPWREQASAIWRSLW